MSQLFDAVRGRVIAPAVARDGASTTTLADLRPGQVARILDVGGDEPSTARRLVDLGFAPGAEVVVVRRAPMADPVVFRVAGCELALRRVQARTILVEPSA